MPLTQVNINLMERTNKMRPCSEINPTTGLVAFGVSGRLRLQNF